MIIKGVKCFENIAAAPPPFVYIFHKYLQMKVSSKNLEGKWGEDTLSEH